MSRSYKKTGAYAICGGSDKWNRTRYHRDERRKVKRLLHETSFEDCYYPETDDVGLGDVLERVMCMVCKDCEENNWYEEYMLTDWEPNANICYNRNGCGRWIPENNPIDKIINNRVDRSLGSADKYGWATDGGAYWRDDKSEIRKEFDEGVFGIKTWTYRRCVFRNGPRNIWDEYCENRDAKYNKKHPMMVVCCYYKKPMEKPSTHTNLDELIGWNWNHEELRRWSIKLPYRRDHWFDPSILPEGAYDVHVYKSRGPSSLRSPKWDVISYALSLAPNSLWGPKDLVEWLRAHEEEIIEGMFKRRFGK